MNKENIEIPLVSFCLVSYNEERFIAEALDAAFAQDYPNMEIIISDDCSKDKTYDVIQKKVAEYKGPHKVVLNRNEPNLGPRENFNKVLYELSHGEFIFIAAGDDISHPQRTRKCVEFMMAHPNVSSMSCVSQLIHEDGSPFDQSPIDSLSQGHVSIFTLRDYVNTSLMINSGDSRVLRRFVIECFPPLKWSYAEDVFLFVRSLYVGDIALIHEPLVRYRQHDKSIMGSRRLIKKATKEQCRVYEETTVKQFKEDLNYAINHHYIQPNQVDIVTAKVNDVIKWLRPRRKTFWWRAVHSSQRHMNNFLNALLKKLE